jgi:hypothetical protein
VGDADYPSRATSKKASDVKPMSIMERLFG